MIGIKAKITMERTLYIDLPDNATENEIVNEAKKEVVLPTNALYAVSQVLHKYNIQIPNLDLSDWNITDIKYNKI